MLYLPPYTPMLNPIESWFGELKRIVKSKIYKTRQAMKAELIRVLETYRNKSMANYYKGIEKYIEPGLQKQLYRGNNKFWLGEGRDMEEEKGKQEWRLIDLFGIMLSYEFIN